MNAKPTPKGDKHGGYFKTSTHHVYMVPCIRCHNQDVVYDEQRIMMCGKCLEETW